MALTKTRAPYAEGTLRIWWRHYRCAPDKYVQVELFGRSMPVPDVAAGAWKLFERIVNHYNYPGDKHFWTWVCRHIGSNPSKPWSLHAYAIAGDMDPAQNPYISNATWDDTQFTPELVEALLAVRTVNGKQVFAWGGQWISRQDLMHWYLACKPSDLLTGIDYTTVYLEENDMPWRYWNADTIRAFHEGGHFKGDPQFWISRLGDPSYSEWPHFYRTVTASMAKEQATPDLSNYELVLVPRV